MNRITPSMPETEEQLAWEARLRPRAGLAAILAALLTVGGGVYNGLVFTDIPRANVLSALERAAQPGPVGGLPSLRIPVYEWYSDHVGQVILGAVMSAAGALAVAGALTFLAFATASRRPLPRAALYLPVIGGVLLAVALLLVAFGTKSTIDRALHGPRTVDAVADVGASTIYTAGQLIEVVARFTFGAAFLLVSLNAMRAGLLTRFMGVLGIIAGVLLALPIGGPLPVVQAFWLFAFGMLLFGRWPSGIPKAWSTGQAEPWPSSAAVRQARVAARGGGRPAKGAPVRRAPADEAEADADAAPVPAGKPGAASKKKRKRRT
jgi:hypothetical protein